MLFFDSLFIVDTNEYMNQNDYCEIVEYVYVCKHNSIIIMIMRNAPSFNAVVIHTTKHVGNQASTQQPSSTSASNTAPNKTNKSEDQVSTQHPSPTTPSPRGHA